MLYFNETKVCCDMAQKEIITENDATALDLLTNENVTSVEVPYGTKKLRDCALYYLENLQSVTIPNTVESLGYRALGISKIERIYIPKSVKSLGEQCFASCSALKEVIFEDGVQIQTLPTQCFMSCTSLEEITIPNSVKTIGNRPFQGCSNLKTIKIDNTRENAPNGNWGVTPYPEIVYLR